MLHHSFMFNCHVFRYYVFHCSMICHSFMFCYSFLLCHFYVFCCTPQCFTTLCFATFPRFIILLCFVASLPMHLDALCFNVVLCLAIVLCFIVVCFVVHLCFIVSSCFIAPLPKYISTLVVSLLFCSSLLLYDLMLPCLD